MKSVPKYDFQVKAREFIRDKPKVGLFMAYGAGKTYTSLQAIADKQADGVLVLPAIVMAPNSLVTQWGQQIKEHSNFKYSLIQGSLSERKVALKQDADLYVVPYSALSSHLHHHLNILGAFASTIIADESTHLKSSKTARFKLVQTYFRNIANRMLLSGKPITEKPDDLWAQMLFLDDGERLGRDYWGFIRRYYDSNPHVAFGRTLKDGAAQEIARSIADICMYVPLEEVAKQLPPRTFIPIEFAMPPEVRTRYKEMKSDYSTEFQTNHDEVLKTYKVETQWAITKTQKLHQMCNGFVYTRDEDDTILSLKCDKFDWMKDIAPDIIATGPTLVWCYHRHTVTSVSDILIGAGISNYPILGGEDNDYKFEGFKTGTIDVLVMSISAAFQGHNLQRAKNAIFFSEGYSGDQKGNALGRNYRSGSDQHTGIFVYELITKNSVEEVIHKTLANKGDMSQELLSYLIKD